MIATNQKLLIANSGGGGGLNGAALDLLKGMEQYENARIVAMSTLPVKNPFGPGDIATQILAVIEHD